MSVETIDGMYDREWLHEFAMATRELMLDVALVNSCILSTRIGLDVLQRHGITAQARAVKAVAYNVVGYRMVADNVPLEDWPETAWAVGIEGTGATDTENRHTWDGHLVLVVRNPNRKRTLIDLTADQMDRPQHGINIPGPVFLDLPSQWTPQDPTYTMLGAKAIDRNATILGYWPQMTAGDWQTTPDWVHDPSGYVDVICERLAA